MRNSAEKHAAVAYVARKWILGGRVQGVGFRPFVYRVAQRCGVQGWVRNHAGEVEIMAQGAPELLQRFGHALVTEAPPLARPKILSELPVAPEPTEDFQIRSSETARREQIHVPPDYFACDDCLAELNNSRDRRFRYPFINCTQCGPRYTLIERLPYDRANTSMARFPCARCARPNMPIQATGDFMPSRSPAPAVDRVLSSAPWARVHSLLLMPSLRRSLHCNLARSSRSKASGVIICFAMRRIPSRLPRYANAKDALTSRSP